MPSRLWLTIITVLVGNEFAVSFSCVTMSVQTRELKALWCLRAVRKYSKYWTCLAPRSRFVFGDRLVLLEGLASASARAALPHPRCLSLIASQPANHGTDLQFSLAARTLSVITDKLWKRNYLSALHYGD